MLLFIAISIEPLHFHQPHELQLQQWPAQLRQSCLQINSEQLRKEETDNHESEMIDSPGTEEIDSHEPSSATSNTAHLQPFRFLDLPTELRRAIYHELLVPHTGRITLDRNEFSPSTNSRILLVSQTVYAEARPIFYSNNIFTMCRELDSKNAWLILNSMGQYNLSLIRKLEITRHLDLTDLGTAMTLRLFLFVWRCTNPETLMKLTSLEEIKLSFAYESTSYIAGCNPRGKLPYPTCCSLHLNEESVFAEVCRHAAKRVVNSSSTLNILTRDLHKTRMNELWRYLTYDLTAS